ncbi:MAG: DUF1697 domain-containing protein [Calditrichaceae bacterium]
MSVYISLLRGINVSGQKKIQMRELKSLYESLGFENVSTYIQSGNVVFSSNENDESKLANLISAKIRKVFSYEVSVIIRSKEYWKNLIAKNPFLKKDNTDIKKMHVTILSHRRDYQKLEYSKQANGHSQQLSFEYYILNEF